MSDLALVNANVRTGDTRRPRARSVLIRGGRVAALDTEADSGATVLDLEGRTAAPGLIDAHLHLLEGGCALEELDLSRASSRREFEAAVAQRHAELPEGRWLLARGWSSENWGGAEPDRAWLAAAGSRPVVCRRMDLHAVLVNAPVLARCDTTADPPGGRIERDAAGEPTGLMVEAAAWRLVNPLVPRPDAAARRRAALAAGAHLCRFGVTSAGAMEYAADVREVLEPLRDRLRPRLRVILLDRDWPMDFAFGRGFRGDGRLDVIGYKTFIDGTLGSRTARMLEDYADDPGNRGLFLELAAQGRLSDWARAVTAAGFVPAMHAIGDEAVRAALGAADALGPARARARIEHAQQVDAADLPRFRDVVASMQPLHKADDGRYAQRRLGERRLDGFFPFRKLLDAGAILAFGSDWPVVSADAIAGMRAAVTGLTLDGRTVGADQNLTPGEALAAYTTGAARAVGLTDAGVLRPGALGDVAVLDTDPLACDWAQRPPRVVMTVVGGEVTYDAR